MSNERSSTERARDLTIFDSFDLQSINKELERRKSSSSDTLVAQRKHLLGSLKSASEDALCGKIPVDTIILGNPYGKHITQLDITNWVVGKGDHKKFIREYDVNGNIIYRPTTNETSVETVQIRSFGLKTVVYIMRKQGKLSPNDLATHDGISQKIMTIYRDISSIHKNLRSFRDSYDLLVSSRSNTKVDSGEYGKFIGSLNDLPLNKESALAVALKLTEDRVMIVNPRIAISVLSQKTIPTKTFGNLHTSTQIIRVPLLMNSEKWDLTIEGETIDTHTLPKTKEQAIMPTTYSTLDGIISRKWSTVNVFIRKTTREIPQTQKPSSKSLELPYPLLRQKPSY